MTTSVLKQNSPGGSAYYATQTAVATDSVSSSKLSTNYCGSYEYYQISSEPKVPGVTTQLSSTDLWIDRLTGVISVYTADSAKVGDHTVTITARLTSYTSLTASKTFTITIQQCVLTSFSMTNLNPSYNQQYNIGDSAKTWTIISSDVVT